eukprot:364775-Chlamydomonas_euryale.AAC.9
MLAAPRCTCVKGVEKKWKALEWARAVKARDLSVKMVPEAVDSHCAASEAAANGAGIASGDDEDANGDGGDGDGKQRASNDGGAAAAGASAGPGSNSNSSSTGGLAVVLAQRKAAIQRTASVFTAVQSIDFSENPFGINGAKVVARVLDPCVTPNQFLHTVKLSKCSIPEAGGMALAKAIGQGNTVREALLLCPCSVFMPIFHAFVGVAGEHIAGAGAGAL